MPYKSFKRNDQWCVYKLDADEQPTGESLGCHPTQAEADAQVAALYASEQSLNERDYTTASISTYSWDIGNGVAISGTADTAPSLELSASMELQYFRGGTVRAIGDGIVEGLLVPWNTADKPDYYGTYFDDKTDYAVEDFPPMRAVILYDHGLDDTMEIRNIAVPLRAKFTDAGLWVQAQINRRDEWERKVYELAEQGKLGWSSGALPQGVRVADDGHVERWPIIDWTLTPQPAAVPYASQIYTRSILQNALHGATNRVSLNTPVEPSDNAIPLSDTLSNQQETRNMEEIMAMLKEALAMLMEYINMEQQGGGEQPAAPMPPEAQQEVMQALTSQMSAKIEAMEKELESMTPAKRQAWIDEELTKLLPDAIATYEKQKAERAARFQSAAHSAYQQIEPQPVAGYHNGNRSMSVSEPRKYWGRDLKQLLFAYRVMKAAGIEMSSDFMRTLAGRTEIGLEKHQEIVDNPYVRSMLPAMRTDEIVTSTAANHGDEWIGVAYSNDLWEVARSSLIMDMLINKGMIVEEVPQGYETVTIFTEGSDPTVYSLTQSADLDATSRPTVIVPVTAPGTGQVVLTPGHLGAAVAFSTVFEEDSLIQAAPQFTRQMDIKARETIDQLFINGDTATSGNVNYDGTTDSTTNYWKASNGARKYALVTGSGTSRSGGTLDDDDFRLTLSLFPVAVQERNEGLAFITDVPTHNQALDILAIKTQDVRGSAATIESGMVRNLYGVDYFRSGFLPLTASDGKVTYNAAGTLGSILAVYAPYWAMGWKRHIKTETSYNPLEQAMVIVNTLRLGFVPRGAGAAVITYNLTVGA